MKWALQVSTRSLSWLSAIWFCLCASLVTKHNELITVFIAFVTCFAVAFVLNRTTSKPSKTQLFEKDSAQWQSVEEKRRMRIKNEVGAAACLLALASNRFDDICQRNHHLLAFDCHYLAVSILTGYLAFDLWYTSLHCRAFSIHSLLEDTLTLTAFLVSLSLFGTNLRTYRSHLLSWIVYRMLAVAARLYGSSLGVDAAEATTTTTTSGPEKTMAELWTVHGIQYDLTDYIDRHPGGKEALELARGRDCTALFESYHPFTNNHRSVIAENGSRVATLTMAKQLSRPEFDGTGWFLSAIR